MLSMDPCISASRSASVSAREPYWVPALLWCTRPVVVNSNEPRRRVWVFCSSADRTRSDRLVIEACQPSIRREYTSTTNET